MRGRGNLLTPPLAPPASPLSKGGAGGVTFDDTPQPAASSSTFGGNLSLPIHRWFRYSAGFSAVWAGDVIRQAQCRGEVRVLDPFAGSGTVLVEAQEKGVAAIGVESHPFVARVARVKIDRSEGAERFKQYASELLAAAADFRPDVGAYPPLIRRCYPDATLAGLDQIRRSWQASAHEASSLSEMGWLVLAAILRPCSPVGTASWQYVLPKKTKSASAQPLRAFEAKANQIVLDLASRPPRQDGETVVLMQDDARQLGAVSGKWATLVVTSPPYPNNFDYADATRLEMSFFGQVAGWGDLQDAVRKHLVRSCTQHVSTIVAETDRMLDGEELGPIREEIVPVVGALEKARHLHGGKKNYHTMIAAYFLDMARVWAQLRRVSADGCRVCFVVGDSAPYGIHVPVERWMGALALAVGFRSYSFVKTRDRNVKWKNRKHRVPLHEGQLWVEG